MADDLTQAERRTIETLLDAFGERLRHQFGLQARREPGRCVVAPLGLPRTVEVTAGVCGGVAVAVVRAVVTHDLDWSVPGLGDVLLRENAGLAFARYSRVADSLVVDYAMPAVAATGPMLGVVVATTVQTVVDGMALLAAVGALRR